MMNRFRSVFSKRLLAVGLFGILPVHAVAQASAEQRIEALEKELKALRQQVEQQSRKVATQGEELQTLVYPAGDSILAKGDGKSLKFSSADDKFSYQVGGRLQLDSAWYRADNPGPDVALGDGTKVRRLFLDVRGVVNRDWNYRFQYDLARPASGDSGARGVRDAWLQYTGFGVNQITFGSFKEYIGLEHLTSGLYTTFIERGVTDLFSPDRHLGIGFSTYRPHWTASIGLFGERPEGDAANEGDEGVDLAGRLTWAPVAQSGRLVHLAAAVRTHDANDSTTELRLRERPESNVTDLRLIDTGALSGVDRMTNVGLEFAAVSGPYSVQAEYIGSSIARTQGSPDLDFNAWYVYGSWFLTGESRVYRTREGLFDRTSPLDAKRGAWELAVRYSHADLTDANVIGGEQDNLTLGVNWYATKNVRLSANYLRLLDFDRPGVKFNDLQLDTLLVRAQIDF